MGCVAVTSPNSVRSNLVKTLIERGVVRVALYPTAVEFAGGHDADDLLLKVDGAYTQQDVAGWTGVDLRLIAVSDLGEAPDRDFGV